MDKLGSREEMQDLKRLRLESAQVSSLKKQKLSPISSPPHPDSDIILHHHHHDHDTTEEDEDEQGSLEVSTNSFIAFF